MGSKTSEDPTIVFQHENMMAWLGDFPSSLVSGVARIAGITSSGFGGLKNDYLDVPGFRCYIPDLMAE